MYEKKSLRPSDPRAMRKSESRAAEGLPADKRCLTARDIWAGCPNREVRAVNLELYDELADFDCEEVE